MKIHHGDGWEIYVGDAIDGLKKLGTGIAHCAATSPPYWGLRDYGVRGQIGLEKDPQAWIRALVDVARELRRVLRPDATFWLNLGDAYAGSGKGATGFRSWETSGRKVYPRRFVPNRSERHPKMIGFKEKDLMMLPARLAIALQEDGWWLRAEIVWAKPNPLPESAMDRPTRSHEMVYLLSPSAHYFYDGDAIRVPYAPESAHRMRSEATPMSRRGSYQPASQANGRPEVISYAPNPAGRIRPSVWTIPVEPFPDEHTATFATGLVEPIILAGTSEKGVCPACGAPWERIVEKGEQDKAWVKACGANADGSYHGKATKDYAASKAQDPSAVKARILAGMRTWRTVGWKPSCGCSPEKDRIQRELDLGCGGTFWDHGGILNVWECADPTCRHVLRQHGRLAGHCGRCRCEAFRFGDPHYPIPALVVDPFSGAATTGLVATRLGRRYRGVELKPSYAEASAERIRMDQAARAHGFEKPRNETEAEAIRSQMRLF